MEELPERHLAPDAVAEEHLLQEELLRQLASLPEDQARVLRLRLLEGRPVAEVAKQLGRSEEAVRALQYRALQELRRRLGEGAGERSGRDGRTGAFPGD